MKLWKINILLTLSFINCQIDKSYEHYLKAIEYEEKNKFEEAIRELNEAININPKFEKAYLDRGIDKSVLGDYSGAIKDMDTLLLLNPNAIQPLVWRAEFKRNIKEYLEAKKDIEKALSMKKVIYEGENIIGPKEFSYDHYFEEGKNFNVELEFIVFERGVINYYFGNYHQALKDLMFCEQKLSEPINTHLYKGLTLIKLGRTKEGCLELNKSYWSGNSNAKSEYEKYCKN